METYIIGLFDRAHQMLPYFLYLLPCILVVFGIAYAMTAEVVWTKFASETDYKLYKLAKIGLAITVIVFVLIFLLLIFIPTGEEVSLLMQNN